MSVYEQIIAVANQGDCDLHVAEARHRRELSPPASTMKNFRVHGGAARGSQHFEAAHEEQKCCSITPVGRPIEGVREKGRGVAHALPLSPQGPFAPAQLQPLVPPQVSHLKQVPLRTMV